jgi:hypothetical protein
MVLYSNADLLQAGRFTKESHVSRCHLAWHAPHTLTQQFKAQNSAKSKLRSPTPSIWNMSKLTVSHLAAASNSSLQQFAP